MKVVLIFALACVGYASCCVTSSDCTADQCCLRQDIMIMSRKRQLVAPIDGFIGPLSGLGICTKKGGEGESCAHFYTCGECQDGLHCVLDATKNTLTTILQKRRVAYIPATCKPVA